LDQAGASIGCGDPLSEERAEALPGEGRDDEPANI